MSDTTMIVLRAAGPCKIKLDWLIEEYAAFQKLAQELEKKLRPKLKKGQNVLWILNYYLEDDYPEKEYLPSPSINCKVFITDKKGRRSEPFEILGLGRGPMIFDDSGNPVFDLGKIIEEAAKTLLQ